MLLMVMGMVVDIVVDVHSKRVYWESWRRLQMKNWQNIRVDRWEVVVMDIKVGMVGIMEKAEVHVHFMGMDMAAQLQQLIRFQDR